MASEPTLSTWKSWRLSHSGRHVFPASSLRQTPPPAEPAKMIFGLFGSRTRLVMRPAKLDGPIGFHLLVETWVGLCAGCGVCRPFEGGLGVDNRCVTSASRTGYEKRWPNQSARFLCVVVPVSSSGTGVGGTSVGGTSVGGTSVGG